MNQIEGFCQVKPQLRRMVCTVEDIAVRVALASLRTKVRERLIETARLQRDVFGFIQW